MVGQDLPSVVCFYTWFDSLKRFPTHARVKAQAFDALIRSGSGQEGENKPLHPYVHPLKRAVHLSFVWALPMENESSRFLLF